MRGGADSKCHLSNRASKTRCVKAYFEANYCTFHVLLIEIKAENTSSLATEPRAGIEKVEPISVSGLQRVE